MKKIDWSSLQTQAKHNLSGEDAQIVAKLAEGKSTPQIAALLGVSRSRVWRRYVSLKRLLIDVQA